MINFLRSKAEHISSISIKRSMVSISIKRSMVRILCFYCTIKTTRMDLSSLYIWYNFESYIVVITITNPPLKYNLSITQLA